MDFFLWTHVKEHIYAVPTRAIEDAAGRVEATVTTVDASNIDCNHEAPMV
jgi:hypothetical protein